MQLVHSTAHGIKVRAGRNGETPSWLRVTPAREGRLPDDTAVERWIRLDAITAVIPHPAFAVGEDRSTWEYIVIVEANGQTYHPTSLRFSHGNISTPIDALLDLISSALGN